MATFDNDESHGNVVGQGVAGHPAGFGTLVNWSGGLVSMALVVGLAVWGYQLLVRDVSGVPVVRALEGPIRVAPEDPGGQRARYQGLAVNEIAAEGTASGPVDQVTLAPGNADLADEDLPLADLAALERAEKATGPAMAEPGEDLTEGETGEEAPIDAAPADLAVAAALTGEDDPTARTLALAEQIAAGVEPLSGSDEEPAGEAVALRDSKGLIRSPRPPVRPAGMIMAASAATAEPEAPAAVEQVSAQSGIEVAPDTLAKGTRLVQLGAFESAEVAREQWGKINGRFEEYFRGKRRVVQRAESGGKTFYRLRAEGFADLGDARRFCSALVADGADCIPVELR